MEGNASPKWNAQNDKRLGNLEALSGLEKAPIVMISESALGLFMAKA